MLRANQRGDAGDHRRRERRAGFLHVVVARTERCRRDVETRRGEVDSPPEARERRSARRGDRLRSRRSRSDTPRGSSRLRNRRCPQPRPRRRWPRSRSATASRNTGSSAEPPSERLITFAPCVRAQSIPTAMSASLPLPLESRTLIGMTFALGAIPTIPRPLFVRAAMIPAVIVPWPLSSCGVENGSNTFRPVTSCPARSGWFRSAPVSMSATVMPLPLLMSHARSRRSGER